MDKNVLFYPKILTTLKGYTFKQAVQDILAGVIVGIIALPLAIAFGIASGATPEQGLITAIVAGFLISLLGGSRVQIGGPTGAFIVIVYGIIQQHGMSGLIIATIMAGVILIIMGLTRMGTLVKFVPTSVVVGFTSGIALVIFVSQIRDLFGLQMNTVPVHFLEKWLAFGEVWRSFNSWAMGISITTIVIIMAFTRWLPKLPAAFMALLITTAVSAYFNLPIETIGTRFGDVSIAFKPPEFPSFTIANLRELIVPAFTIAILAAIESLLCAVVADGMIGGKHRSNTELISQGIANIITPLFGGIPATGAIARTATNVRNGGRTPIAGMVHSAVLLIIVFFAANLAKWIPMATLAGILVVVSYNMSEWREFRSLLRAPKSDVTVLLVTFALTVIFDLSIAIQIGMVLSSFTFMHQMAKVSSIQRITKDMENEEDTDTYYIRPEGLSHFQIPPHVEAFEAHGAFFFGAASKFEEVLRESALHTRCIILRMNNIYVLDATGLKALAKFAEDVQHSGTRFILTEINESCLADFNHSRVFQLIGAENIFNSMDKALAATSSPTASH